MCIRDRGAFAKDGDALSPVSISTSLCLLDTFMGCLLNDSSKIGIIKCIYSQNYKHTVPQICLFINYVIYCGTIASKCSTVSDTFILKIHHSWIFCCL